MELGEQTVRSDRGQVSIERVKIQTLRLYNGIKTKHIILPDPHMGTEKSDVSGIPFTSTPLLAYDDKRKELSSTSWLWPLTPSRPLSLCSDRPFSRGWLAPESVAVYSDPSTYPCFPWDGDA